MSVKEVREYLKQWDANSRIQEFPISSATVTDAARALGTEEKRIAKTMAFKLSDSTILVVTAGDARIDNRKFKETFGVKAAMLKPGEVEPMTGHPIGGVCPFAVKQGVLIYLDVSLKRFDTVYPACGSDSSAIGVTILELEKYSHYTEWVDVCKNWES